MKQNQIEAAPAPAAAAAAADAVPAGVGAMSPAERRAAAALASIFSLRMLGLFMILPVFTLHATRYSGYTATRAGLAIGIYGLTQALLQIPFGMLSDRIGRKPVICFGLLVFALGSALAALSHSILWVIAGRALQGMGAVGSAVLALTADLTREEHRTKAMAMIGGSIGLAFGIGIVAGPIITSWVGLPGLFWATAILALAGVAVLFTRVPNPVSRRFHRDTEPVPAQFARVLRDTQLLRLDAGIMSLHMILMASFVVMPLVLRDRAGLPASEHWMVYLLVLVFSIALMVPFVIFAEKRGWMKQVFAGAVLTLACTQVALYELDHTLAAVVVLLLVFFTAFNVLEATLPSLVSRLAPADKKGTALGVYSTSQFLGAFIGGLCGGWLYGHVSLEAVFVFCAAVAAVWFLLAATMRSPRALSSQLLSVGELTEEEATRLASELATVSGVAEAVVVVEDGVAYLKVDRRQLDEQALRAFSIARA